MEFVQVDKYNDVRRSIIRKKEDLENYARQDFLTQEEKETIRYVIAALEMAKLICREVLKMERAIARGFRRAARNRYAEARKLAEIFWACVFQLEIEAIYAYEFLTPLIEDFPGPLGP